MNIMKYINHDNDYVVYHTKHISITSSSFMYLLFKGLRFSDELNIIWA